VSNQAGMPSPRMTVKQVIRAVPQPHQPQQIPTAAASVLVKTTSQVQPSMPHQTIVTQELSKAQPRPTYIQQGNKLIEAYVPPGSRGEVIFVEGKHTMYPNYQTAKYPVPHQQQQPVPSPTQNKPTQIIQQVQTPQQSTQTQPKIVEKIPSQPSVSIQHIPMHQQKVYLTNSGQVIPMPPQQASQSEAVERQQWITHEKILATPQTLKSRYAHMEFEEAHQRAQHQAAAAQQQQQIKRIYVNEPPQGTHSLPSPSQPPHHASSNVVQGKTVIGLNQTPQILTGAVASPPLKAHMSSQQPIVTGKIIKVFFISNLLNSILFLGASSSRIAVPTASPKEQQHMPRHYPHEAYEEQVMVSLVLSLCPFFSTQFHSYYM
jgi:hypothetical protein